jgi:hypothetical protein
MQHDLYLFRRCIAVCCGHQPQNQLFAAKLVLEAMQLCDALGVYLWQLLSSPTAAAVSDRAAVACGTRSGTPYRGRNGLLGLGPPATGASASVRHLTAFRGRLPRVELKWAHVSEVPDLSPNLNHEDNMTKERAMFGARGSEDA